MGTLLISAGLVGLIIGLYSLVYPLQQLRIRSRKQAGIMLAFSFVILLTGGALRPADGVTSSRASAPTTEAPTTTAAPVTAPGSVSTTSQAETTSSTTSTTTSVATTTTAAAVVGSMVEVVEVVDGDTVVARFADGGTDTVRLIGINAPEDDECYADSAAEALSDLVVGVAVELTIDESARDIYDRLLRYVWVDDTLVNEQLVAGGYAIARRYPPDTKHADALETAQVTAIDAEAGMWAADACGEASSAQLAITDLVWDPPGNDTNNLNGELVTIANTGAGPVDFTGWVLKDESASHRYHFPAGFVLLAGEATSVHTGCGPDTNKDLYWCWTSSAIWNNDGDTAFVMDRNGNIVVTYSYHDAMATTTTSTLAETTTTGASGGNCDSSYPTVCIPPKPPDLNCGDIPHRRFTVLQPDPHGFDGDKDGVGCESG